MRTVPIKTILQTIDSRSW